MSTSEIMELIQNHSRINSTFPTFTLPINQRIDKINRDMNSIVLFRKVGDKLIGFVLSEKDENFIDVLDGMGNHHILLGTVDRKTWSLRWNPYWFVKPDLNRYVVGEMRTLKKTFGFDMKDMFEKKIGELEEYRWITIQNVVRRWVYP